jgi:CheY-like chemotaxis protein
MLQILLAEDNLADVYLIREALAEYQVGADLRVVNDGQQVLQMLGTDQGATEIQRMSMIILDLNLPRHDGIEVLEWLRAHPDLTHVPVVVLTSSDSPRDRLNATRLGATCFLRKPSGLEEFLGLGAVFKDLLERSHAVNKSE